MARLFPLRIRDEFAHLSVEDLRPRYRKWDHVGTALFLVLAPLLTYGLNAVFAGYAWSRARRLSGSVYTLVPQSPLWYAPAAVIGSILACVLVYFVYNLALRERVSEYRYYSNLNAGFNASGMFLAFGVILGIGFLALTYFAAQSHVLLGNDKIVFRRLWSLAEEHHPYTAVTALKEIRDRGKDGTTFVIELENAMPWTTRAEIIFLGERERQFLSERSGKKIERLDRG